MNLEKGRKLAEFGKEVMRKLELKEFEKFKKVMMEGGLEWN